MIIAVLMVAAALFLLMGSWRTAVIALCAIVLSFVTATLALKAAGVSLNMMAIAGLLMGAGVVVRDGILDISNALHRLRKPRDGRSSFLVIARAIQETRRPMLYASLIAVIAALPVLFIQGRSVAFFEPMLWAYIAPCRSRWL